MRAPRGRAEGAGEPGTARPSAPGATSFAERERLAETAIDHWAGRLRDEVSRVVARTREQAEDLWADAQEERRQRDGA